MKNILFFISGLGSGGAQRQIVELSVGFKERGYNCRFLIYQKKWSEYYSQYLMDRGIEIDGIYEDNYIKRIYKVRKYIRNNKYDIVIAFLEAPSFMAELATFPLKKWKLIVGERSADPAKLTSLKLKFFLKCHVLSDYVVANSQSNINIIRKVAPRVSESKCKVIYNMLDSTRLSSNIDFEFRKNGYLHLVVASSHRYLKNLNGLIEGVAMLNKEERNQLKISWYGNSKFDSSLIEGKKKIDEYGLNSIFSFYNETLDIYKYMSNADVIGLFSFFEGFPNAICEGMLLGKPVIVTKVSDIPLFIKEDINGYLCEASDPLSISQALSSLLSCKPDRLKSIGMKNRELAQHLFDKKMILDSYEALF